MISPIQQHRRLRLQGSSCSRSIHNISCLDANDCVFDRVDEYDRQMMMRPQQVKTSSRPVNTPRRSSLSSASAHTPRSFQRESEKDLLTMINEFFSAIEWIWFVQYWVSCNKSLGMSCIREEQHNNAQSVKQMYNSSNIRLKFISNDVIFFGLNLLEISLACYHYVWSLCFLQNLSSNFSLSRSWVFIKIENEISLSATTTYILLNMSLLP